MPQFLGIEIRNAWSTGIATNCSPSLPLERRRDQARFHQALWMEGPPGRTPGAARVCKPTLLPCHGGHPKCRFGRWDIFAATPPTNFLPVRTRPSFFRGSTTPDCPCTYLPYHAYLGIPPFRYDWQRSVRGNTVRDCIEEPTASGIYMLTWDRSNCCMRLTCPCNRATGIPICAALD